MKQAFVQRFFSQRVLDRLQVIHSGYDPDFIEPSELTNPVPAYHHHGCGGGAMNQPTQAFGTRQREAVLEGAAHAGHRASEKRAGAPVAL